MSGISGVNSSTSSTSTDSGTLGNAPPISFPGIASGIDYNAIIEKLTSLTLAQNQPLTAENKTLAAQNAELLKINGLIQQVQGAITALGDPTLFSSFSATSSDTSLASAAQIAGSSPTAGTYTIFSQSLATATEITSDPAANAPVNVNNPLDTAGFQITPTNGSTTGNGKFTVNGSQFTYDVGTDTIADEGNPNTSILDKLNAIAGIQASFQNDELTITSTGGPLSLGSASDAGNLEQIFKLDTAPILSGQQQVSGTADGNVVATNTLATYGIAGAGDTITINGQTITYNSTDTVQSFMNQVDSISGVQAVIQNNKLVIETTNGTNLAITNDTQNFMGTFNGGFGAATSYQSVTSSSAVGGIDPDATLNVAEPSLNGGSEFTINGVALSINPSGQSLTDIINEINSSNAGVNASWNVALGQLQLVAKSTGPQSIVLGAPGDSSNFLSAFGLTTAGATTQVGQQASVTYQTPSGGTATVYSNSNNVTNVIPGVTLTLQQTSNSPYTVTVGRSTTNLVTAINNFVTAYNNAINELDSATAPPVVQTQSPGTPLQSGTAQSSVTVPGGVLFTNSSVQTLKDQLVNLVSGLIQNGGSTSYNSLASVGLLLDTSFAEITSTSTSGSSGDSKDSSDSADSSGLQTQTFDGTSGKLQALDATTLDSALLANPAAVQSIFTGDSGIMAQLGTYLTFVSGSPTQLGPNGNFLGTAPDVSLLQGVENANSAQIDSINQQIALVNDMAVSQANQLREQFTASEAMIAELQQEQSSLASMFGTSSTSSSS